MSSSQPNGAVARFFSRVDVRLTFWFTLVFLTTSLVLFGLVFVNLYQTLQDQDRRELQSRALNYVVRYRSFSTEEPAIEWLINEMFNDVQSPGARPFFGRIVSSTNRELAITASNRDWENLDLSPLTHAGEIHDQGFVTLDPEVYPYEIEVLGARLSDRFVLQLGAATDSRSRVLAIFQRSFLVVFLIMFGVSVGAGFFFAARTLRPIGSLNAAIKSIVETGALDRRIPASNARDDLDDMTHAFNAMLDRIQRLVTTLRDALDSVAHDLRTPLTRLRNTAERAIVHETDPAKYREALSDAMEESERILGMLNAMMDISEAESGTMNLHLEEVDLAAIARQVREVYSLVAEQADMEISLQSPPTVPVYADAPRLRQVVGNLYDNAVKYGEPGTTVYIACRNGTTANGVAAGIIDVTNYGSGILEEDRERIWTRLYRGTSLGSRRDGLGLGLALVKAIVEAHGGDVKVESTPGEQTTFTISIPS
ncbi:MAG: ATP-binding protein, partial [Spirochaetales bacterium]